MKAFIDFGARKIRIIDLKLPIFLFIFIFVINIGLGLISAIKMGVVVDNEEPTNMVADNNPQSSTEEGLAKPLVVSHHATITNSYLSSSLPMNASYILSNGWSAKNTTINYKQVSQKKDWIINGQFTTTSTPWVYYAKYPTEIINLGRQSGGYMRIRIPGETSLSAGDYGYYQETLAIDQSFTPNKIATLSLNFYYEGGTPLVNTLLYMAIIINGVEKNITAEFSELVYGQWTNISMNYEPISFGQSLPSTDIKIRAGVAVNGSVTNGGYSDYINLDNIQLKIWTQINQSYIIKTQDYDTSFYYPYQNSSSGNGYAFIDVEKNWIDSQQVIFTISQNLTGILDFEIYNITISAEVVKNTNSTVSGDIGSVYNINGAISWETDFQVVIPYSYIDTWIEIEKPSDWIITHLYDGYDIDQVNNCFGIGFNSNKIIIPSSVVSGGLWNLFAESRNYIENFKAEILKEGSFSESSQFYVGDLIRFKVELNNTIILTDSLLNITIKYPNNTLFYKFSQEPESEVVYIGNFTIGLNMSVGNYITTIEWINSHSVSNIDQVGKKVINFNIIHKTSLNPIESTVIRASGELLLLKVRLKDVDLDVWIDSSVVMYNSSIGESGLMAYIGSGTYFVEVNTSKYELGDYYFSFNSSTQYYQNISINDLIHLTIISEKLVLSVPRQVNTVQANTNAYFYFNVTGELSKAFLYPANLTTDWFRDYSVDDFNNGTYRLNVSTSDVTTGSTPETYSITIFANKTNYTEVSDIVLLTINPIPTLLSVNTSLIEVALGNQFYVEVNYTNEDTTEPIIDANISVNWIVYYHITRHSSGFIILFNSTGLLLDHYNILIQLNHTGFESQLKLVYVIIYPMETVFESNVSLVQVSFGKSFEVKFNYTIEITGQVVPDHELTITWATSYQIYYEGNDIIVSFDTSGLLNTQYVAIVKIESAGYQTQIQTIMVMIIPIKSDIIVLNFAPVEIVKGDEMELVVNFLADGQPFSGGSLTIVGDFEGDFQWNGTNYIFNIQTLDLQPKIYFAQIIGTGPNIETKIKDIFIKIVPLEIEIQLSANLIKYDPSKDNIIEFSAYDLSHNVYLSQLCVNYSINGQIYQTLTGENGICIIDLDTLDLKPSPVPYMLEITVDNPLGENQELTISIIVPINYDSYVVMAFIIISILGGISLYLFLNNKYFKKSRFQRVVDLAINNLNKIGNLGKMNHTNRENMIEKIIENS